MSKVTDYVDNLFFLMPRTDAAAEMRQKLMESAEDKYEALVSWGKNEDEALGIVVSEFGSMEEICAELGVMPIGMGADSREEQLARDYSFLNRRFSQGLGFGIILCVLGLVACILLEEMFFASDAILGRGAAPAGRHRRRDDYHCLHPIRPGEETAPDGYPLRR